MKSKKITIALSYDWMGLYLDGKLVTQNHSISIYDLLNHVKIPHQIINVDDEWLVERGNLPEDLSEVRKENESEID